MLTSICRSIVTICSGLYLLIGMTSFSSKWILSHSTWYKNPRSRQSGPQLKQAVLSYVEPGPDCRVGLLVAGQDLSVDLQLTRGPVGSGLRKGRKSLSARTPHSCPRGCTVLKSTFPVRGPSHFGKSQRR